MSAENNTEASSSSSDDEKFSSLKEYTEEEIAEHDQEDDVWIVIDARVYDISTFKAEHPGGGDVLMDVAGKDATESFEDIFHSENAREQLPDLCVGRVQGKTPGQNRPAASSEDDSSGMQYGILFVLLFLIAAAVYQVYFVQGGDDAAGDIASAATAGATTAADIGEL